MTKTKI